MCNSLYLFLRTRPLTHVSLRGLKCFNTKQGPKCTNACNSLYHSVSFLSLWTLNPIEEHIDGPMKFHVIFFEVH
jgi:hypothetical protein